MRSSTIDRDWTKGSLIRNLLSLSWPILIGQCLTMVGPTIDLIWVGRLGSAAIAGVGISGIVIILSAVATMGLITGMRAIIARLVGAGDREGASHASKQAFILAIGYSAVIAVIGFFLAEPLLRAYGVEDDVVREGAAYLRIMFIGGIAMSLRLVTESAMQASGDTMTPMKMAIVYRIFHTALCPFLILGWWIFPEMGVRGAAISNSLSEVLGLVLGLWVLLSGRTRLQVTLSNLRLDPGMIWRMVRIGIPTMVMSIQHQLCTLVLIWLVTPFGTLSVAAHSLWHRVDSIMLAVSISFGMGAGVMAGQNLGAGQPERAEKSGWLAGGVVAGCMLIGTLMVLLLAEKVVGIFNNDPELVDIGSDFLRIAAVGYLGLGFNMVYMQVLINVGDTIPAMTIEIIANWLGQVALAWVLSTYTPFGVYGIRWAMVIGIALGGAIFMVYFWRGWWKRKRV